MDEWLDSLSVNMTTRVRIPLNVLFFFFFVLFFSPLFPFFLSLLAWADICAAELATWGVGPDVMYKGERNLLNTCKCMRCSSK